MLQVCGKTSTHFRHRAGQAAVREHAIPHLSQCLHQGLSSPWNQSTTSHVDEMQDHNQCASAQVLALRIGTCWCATGVRAPCQHACWMFHACRGRGMPQGAPKCNCTHDRTSCVGARQQLPEGINQDACSHSSNLPTESTVAVATDPWVLAAGTAVQKHVLCKGRGDPHIMRATQNRTQ